MSVSAVNLSWQIGARNTSKLVSPLNSDQSISLSFGGSESMGLSFRPSASSSTRAKLRKQRHGSPLRVVCIDYPRPELENTVNFLEAAYLSSTFRASPRPTKPLKVVIAGAGNKGKFCLYPFSFNASKL